MISKSKSPKKRIIRLSLLVIICIGTILLGGVYYISSLRTSLMDQAVHNVLAVTIQQQQAFDNFLSGDLERIRSFAEYFAQGDSDDDVRIRHWLEAFHYVDAEYLVFNLDTGTFYSNKTYEASQLENEELEFYRSLSGGGVREPFADDTKIGYYECFTFADGASGLIQKSYECTKISEDFSLSFYNNQGFAYIVNEEGNILIRSLGMLGDHLYSNILEILAGHNDEQEKIDNFIKALKNGETGSLLFTGNGEDFVYTYVPVRNTQGWYLVSVVRESAITAETDVILQDSQLAVGFLFLVLIVCAVFILMIWRTNREIEEKNLEIAYQEQLFDIFATYLANNTNDIYLMIDASQRQVEYVSPNAERIMGISVQNSIDRAFFAGAVYASGKAFDFDELYRLEPGMSLETILEEWRNPHTDEHKYFQISTYCTLVQEARKIILYISDRTKEREVQDTLAEALRIAQVANEAKSAFLSNVSHDIRTPMNAIVGFTSLAIAHIERREQVEEYLKKIMSSGNHLLNLINDVLDMSHIESGKMNLEEKPCSLPEILHELCNILQGDIRKKKLRLQADAVDILNETVYCDKLRLNQVLLNLFSNSIKYTNEGGSITLRVVEKSGAPSGYANYEFSIRDTGIGMSEEFASRIFEPFERENNSTISGIQGTGLGMSITKSIVDAMKGDIKVKSKQGQGTEFIVSFTFRIRDGLDKNQEVLQRNGLKVLIINDSPEGAGNISCMLERLGIESERTESKENVLRHIAGEKGQDSYYDACIIDWFEPDMDVPGIIRRVRKELGKPVPVIVTSAYDWAEVEDEAKEGGVTVFCSKPLFISELGECLRFIATGEKISGSNNGEVREKPHTGRILLAEDVELNQEIAVAILEDAGFTAEVAENGQVAVDMVSRSEPGYYQLVLMDIQMPVMNGYEATKAIRRLENEKLASIPIFAMSANAFEEDRRESLKCGMNGHIAKPIDIDRLLDTLSRELC